MNISAISSSNTAPVTSAPSSPPKTTDALDTPPAAASASATDTVHLSLTARQAIASGSSSAATKAISGLKTYPTDLSTRYDELASKKTLTTDETAEALKLNQERNAREEQAFFQYARQANAAATPQERSRLMAQFNKSYTEYYDGLSSAEQASPRYAGTRAGAVSDYVSWSQEAGQAPDDLSASGNPISMLFDKIKQQAVSTTQTKSASSAQKGTGSSLSVTA